MRRRRFRSLCGFCSNLLSLLLTVYHLFIVLVSNEQFPSILIGINCSHRSLLPRLRPARMNCAGSAKEVLSTLQVCSRRTSRPHCLRRTCRKSLPASPERRPRRMFIFLRRTVARDVFMMTKFPSLRKFKQSAFGTFM